MASMFQNSNINSLDLSYFDTSNVTSMLAMFAETEIVNLNLNNWNTSNVVNMRGMFSKSNIDKLDLSLFSLNSKVEMNAMFSEIKRLKDGQKHNLLLTYTTIRVLQIYLKKYLKLNNKLLS